MSELLNTPTDNRAGLGKPAGDRGTSSSGQAVETEETALRDNRGLLQLQKELMKAQDEELDSLSVLASSTHHIAVAVNDELNLQTRLLDHLEDDIDHTGWSLKKAKLGITRISKKAPGNCGLFMLVLALLVLLVLVLSVFHVI
eukprot:jgi/Mesvir1/23018/Mv14613-RA.1